MKTYNIFVSGGEKVKSVCASCITKACKSFIETLDKPAKYKLESKAYASIRYTDNYTICSDFVVMEAE